MEIEVIKSPAKDKHERFILLKEYQRAKLEGTEWVYSHCNSELPLIISIDELTDKYMKVHRVKVSNEGLIKQTVQTIYDKHKVKLDSMKDNLRSLDNPTDAEFNLIHEQIRALADILGDLFKKVLSDE